MANAKAENRIEKANLAIMKHPSFCAWAGLLFIGGWSVSDTVKTAQVDSRGHCEYGRTFIDNCVSEGGKDKEVVWTVLHENGHKALHHCTRAHKLYKVNKEAAAAAVDHVVNNMIEDLDPHHEFASPPRQIKVYMDRKYKDKSIREVFDDIMKNGAPPANPFDEHEFKELEESDKSGPEQEFETVESFEQEIDSALRSGSYMAGKMGGKQNRTLADLMTPKVDWRDALREFVIDCFVGDDYATWARPNRRFVGVGTYLPSTVGEQIGELVCAIDTSGSVGHREMTAMVSEVISIAKMVRPTGIRIIYWSDGVESEEYYEPDQYDDIPRLTKPVGGGGTVVTPVADRLSELENIQCAVVLTDGGIYGSFGDWPCPTLWAITTSVVSPVGKTVHFEVEY